MDTLPWYAWVAIIGAIGWAAMVIVGATGYGRSKRGGGDLQRVIAENTAASKAILDRLDQIDARLSTVEKTLTDIPS
jgi:hypothetical protein